MPPHSDSPTSDERNDHQPTNVNNKPYYISIKENKLPIFPVIKNSPALQLFKNLAPNINHCCIVVKSIADTNPTPTSNPIQFNPARHTRIYIFFIYTLHSAINWIETQVPAMGFNSNGSWFSVSSACQWQRGTDFPLYSFICNANTANRENRDSGEKMVPGIAYKSITDSACICMAVATLSCTRFEYDVICERVTNSNDNNIVIFHSG